jgi:hypothetical protein
VALFATLDINVTNGINVFADFTSSEFLNLSGTFDCIETAGESMQLGDMYLNFSDLSKTFNAQYILSSAKASNG